MWKKIKIFKKFDFCFCHPADLIDFPNLSLELRQAIVKMVRQRKIKDKKSKSKITD